MPFGLTPEGFFPPTQDEIREELNDAFRAAYGESINLDDGTIEGRLVGILSERYKLLWEILQAIVSSQDPDAAEDTLLEAICALSGTLREGPTPSTVTLTLTGDDATTVPAGSLASTESTDAQFTTLEDVDLADLDAWQDTTPYAVDDRVSNLDACWICTDDGTSAGSGGPDPDGLEQGDTIVDGTVTWRLLGLGTAAADVEAECTETGPTAAVSGDITEIDTPVSGWTSVYNLLDADLGTNLETDEDLRIRRETELARPGNSPKDAIRADLLELDDVTSVTVFMNTTDLTDGDGMPPHSVEALVRGGDDQDIFDQLLASVAAGIATYGTETGTAEDDEGFEETVMFSRPDEIEIYVDLELIIDPDTVPEDWQDQVKAAIVAYGDAQNTGKNAVASAIAAQCFTVAGILDVTVCDIGIASNPSASTTIAIARRELAVFDTSRITIVDFTEETP